MNLENTGDLIVLRTSTSQNRRSSKVYEGLSIRASKVRRFEQALKLNSNNVFSDATKAETSVE